MKKNLILGFVIFCLMFVTASIQPVAAKETGKSYTEGAFTYEVVSGKAWLKSYDGSDEHVVVPATLGGYSVEVICQRAFQSNHAIKSITFSEGLLGMQPESILYCNSLERICLPSTFGSAGDSMGMGGSIYGCEKLAEIIVPDDNKALELYDGVLYTEDMETLIFYPPADTREVLRIPEGVKSISSDSCRDNKYVKEIVMPDTVTYIGYWAFIHDTALEKIRISENCETIGQFAIQNTAIKELRIPASVNWIMAWGIRSNSQLEKIVVDEENTSYYSEDGVLFSENALVLYPAAKKDNRYKVKNGIETIGASAFEGAMNLKEVVLPYTVRTIGDGAFWDCNSLEKVNLLNGIEKIGEHAFANCQKLKRIVLPYSLQVIPNVLGNAETVTIQENVTRIEEQGYFNALKEVYFAGNVPENMETMLTDMKGERVIYYPRGNETWDGIASKYVVDGIVWKEHVHDISEEWFVDWPSMEGKPGQKSQRCIICGAVCKTVTEEIAVPDIPIKDEIEPDIDESIKVSGLAQASDGNWYYYVNGKADINFNGLYCDANVGWWLVLNGKVAFDYNGLYCDANYGWWLISGGAVNFGYTGLYCDANYGWWLISGGAVAFDYTGLWGDPTFGWWLIGNGAVCFDYTGLWGDPNYGWWLIGNGAVCFDYNGLWNDPNYGWWLINGGTIPFGYTGLYYDVNLGWWYIQNGAIGFGYTGEVYYESVPYYVVNGQLM